MLALESVVDKDILEIWFQLINHLLGDSFELVGLKVLPHVVPLDEPPLAERAGVRLLPAVDLPVPVERAGVGQLLAANLARHHRLAVWAQLGVSELCVT